MSRTLLLLLGIALLGGAAYWFLAPQSFSEVCPLEDDGTAPSGRTLSLCNVVYEVQPDNAIWAVVRVLDPGLVTSQGHDDHDWVCDLWGLPAMEKEPNPVRLVVQIMAEPFERDEPSPGITQSIEAYTVRSNTCRWELL